MSDSRQSAALFARTLYKQPWLLMSLIGKWVYLRGRGMEEVTFTRPLQSTTLGKGET